MASEITKQHKQAAITGYFRMGATVELVYNLSWVTQEFTLYQIQTINEYANTKIIKQ